MSFEDDMVKGGFYDEQDYFEYICDKSMQEAEKRMIEDRQNEEEKSWDEMLEKCHRISEGYLHNFKSANEYVRKGDEYSAKGEPLLAEECYKKAIEKDENDADIYYKLGKANHFSVGYLYEPYCKYNKAITNYLKAIELRKDFYEAYSRLADCYHSLQNYDEAILYWQRALELNHPNRENLLIFIAETYIKLKKYDKVIEYNLTTSPRGLITLGYAYFEKAIECYQDAARLGQINAQEWLKKREYTW
jgi:tetratricopeptide (TPR) repeat protein